MSARALEAQSRSGTGAAVKVKLPFPPSDLSAHAKGNFRGKSNVTKEWRSLAWATALDAVSLPQFPDGSPYTADGDIHLTIRFYPPNRRGDRTNFPNRCKPIFDGLADAWGVNDARFVPHFEFHAPEAPGRVEIEVK